MRRLRGDDECVVALRDDVGGIWVRVIMSVPSERDGAWAAGKNHLRKKFKSEIEYLLLWVCGDIEQFLLFVVGMSVLNVELTHSVMRSAVNSLGCLKI